MYEAKHALDIPDLCEAGVGASVQLLVHECSVY